MEFNKMWHSCRHQAKQFLKNIWNKGTRKLLFGEEGRGTVKKYSCTVLGKEEKNECKNKRKRWDTYTVIFGGG